MSENRQNDSIRSSRRWHLAGLIPIVILAFGMSVYASLGHRKSETVGTQPNPVVAESPTAGSDREWPPSQLASLYVGFDSTLAQGQIGKTKLIDALTANVCIGYLESMLTEYEFVEDLIPVTPVMVSQEARAQFWPRFIRLEGFKTINMDGMSIDARLWLLRRYVNLVNRGLDVADQTTPGTVPN